MDVRRFAPIAALAGSTSAAASTPRSIPAGLDLGEPPSWRDWGDDWGSLRHRHDGLVVTYEAVVTP